MDGTRDQGEGEDPNLKWQEDLKGWMKILGFDFPANPINREPIDNPANRKRFSALIAILACYGGSVQQEALETGEDHGADWFIEDAEEFLVG